VLLLMFFALIAGAGTAITPCVLPVVPALLSASATGGRRRPLAIVLGLALTFTVAIVALAQLVKGVGLASSAARDAAIVVLIAFGLVMLIPGIAARVQAPLSRLARFGPRQRGSGFWSGLAVGSALGFVCAPCAGPILAAVTAVSASSGPSLRVVVVAISYSIGLAAVMLLYGIGGRAILHRVRRVARGHLVEQTLGVVLLITGVAMAFNLDVRFEEALAGSSLPSFLVDPTRSLENSGPVQNRLASLRPPSRFAVRQREASAKPLSPGHASATASATGTGVAIAGVPTPKLPDLGTAPDFTDTQRWFNTPGGRPLTLAGLRGHVVLVDFWTYTCINCIRTLPFLKGLYATYHRYGFDVVGVEAPEFTFEQNAANVQQAIHSDGLRYPVVQDNNLGTWNAYGNQYWPAEYLIDSKGQVRHVQFGEGDYGQSEVAVRELLYQAGVHNLPPPSRAHAIMPTQLATPETYLDDQRSRGFVQPLESGVGTYQGLTDPQPNEFALKGTWRITDQSATSVTSGDNITLRFLAAHAYLVMTSRGNRPRTVRVLMDGKPIPSSVAGSDVHHGLVTVRGQRLYSLVSLPNDQSHVLQLDVPPGVSAYDFTFG
jgi:cytochrome c biogenesis protein CcdA/thiol-disulfide isomerase/thioredoxin